MTADSTTIASELVYDAVTMSSAPESALAVAAALTAAAVVVWLLQRKRGPSLRGLAIFLAIAALAMTATGIALRVEHLLLAQVPLQRVQGPLAGLWERSVRRAGEQNFYWEWQGFSVAGVAFTYLRNAEQNHFHNGGAHALDLRDGIGLRVHYVERIEDGQPQRRIVRLERYAEASPPETRSSPR